MLTRSTEFEVSSIRLAAGSRSNPGIVPALVLLHWLLTVAAGVSYVQPLGSAWTGWLAVPAAQFCLLGIWLAVGSIRAALRVPLAVFFACLLFATAARFDLAVGYHVPAGSSWLEGEWVTFLSLQRAGDLLIQMPILILIPALLLVLTRRKFRSYGFAFDTRILLAWTAASAGILLVAFRTAPFPGWLSGCLQAVGQHLRTGPPDLWCSLGQALLTVAVSLGIGLMVAGRGKRAFVSGGLVVAAAAAGEYFLKRNLGTAAGSVLVTSLLVVPTLWLARSAASLRPKPTTKGLV